MLWKANCAFITLIVVANVLGTNRKVINCKNVHQVKLEKNNVAIELCEIERMSSFCEPVDVRHAPLLYYIKNL